jgi:predicted nucleic acid-binding protein/ribosomal protein S18 acetylase RimI-like enzyme
MDIDIFQIDHNSKLLKDVIALGDANKNTLGLFPKDAYHESASKKRIIVAVNKDSGKLIGYLLYSLSRQKMLVSIVHLCIDVPWRGNGVPRLLFDKLKELTQDGYLSVRVRCRVDYSANRLWPKLGFVAVGEMDGRGKKNTKLTIWKFEYEHTSLFSYAADQYENLKVKVVIDANIFYQLQHPEILENEESLPLLEPWLDIELYVTPEMLNEINRNKDINARKAARNFFGSFSVVNSKSSHNNFQDVQEQLKPIFPASLSQSDESDLRQLAYAIADEIPFFVTRDGPMLGRTDDVFEKFGIQILRPSDLILMQDELLRGDEYVPSRLAGSQIRIERVHSQQSEKLIERFLCDQEETKGTFRKTIQLLLGNASTIETFVVMDAQGVEHGLISYSRQFNGEIVVPVFRVGKAKICQYVAKYLVNKVVLTASAEKRNLIRVVDAHLPAPVIFALQDNGFIKVKDGWFKATLPKILRSYEVIEQLSSHDWPDYAKGSLNNLASSIPSSPNKSTLLEIEKNLWPLKIGDIDLPCFIVPIRPEWAMHLFDVDIASQDLFGGDPTLILNAENVYYRKSSPKVLSAPGRVLWYVSQGKKRYQGLMFIKACSYLDDVEIGKPKQLFSKYKKLGIYKWADVYNDVAEKDLDKKIMAFKFSKTEIFKHPIHLSDLQAIWKSDGKTFNNAVSPLLINNDRFLQLYSMGMRD